MKTFGKKGIWIIFIVAICFALPNCVAFPGLSNTVIPIIAAQNNMDMAEMITISGYLGWLGLPAMLLWAKLGEKKGAKLPVVLGLVGCAISFAILANVTSLTVWYVSVVAASAFTTGLAYAGPALIANWFPTKKGMALGWGTMGVICVDLFWTPHIATPILSIGYSTTLWIATAISIVIAIIAWITIKDTPEEAGVFPDNLPHPEVGGLAEKIAHMKATYVTDWTLGRVVKSRYVWTIGVATGLFWMAASGPVVSFYGRLGYYGYDAAFIGQVFTIAALFSLLGSWLFGMLDQKTSPKTALIVFGIVAFICSLILRFLVPLSAAWVYIGAILAFACVGGIPNLQASLMTSIWGRWDYSSCAKFIQPVALFFVMCSSVLMGVSLGITGDYELFMAILTGAIVIGFILMLTLKVKPLGKSDDEVALQVYGKTMAQMDK